MFRKRKDSDEEIEDMQYKAQGWFAVLIGLAIVLTILLLQ